ncbi:MAG: 2-oxoglutarate oxidoreductase, partial [Bacteroidales bacterium]|nr:2-oxoglutarate oxidoreductase [Bacteroidales bacterium]
MSIQVKSMDVKDIIKKENLVYKKSPLMTDNVLSYCPGCGHGTVHNIIAEVIEELGIQSQTIAVAPVGCSVLAYEF